MIDYFRRWVYIHVDSLCTTCPLTICCLVSDVICSCFCCIYIMFYHFQAICYIFVFFIIRGYIFQCNFIIECISHFKFLILCFDNWNMIDYFRRWIYIHVDSLCTTCPLTICCLVSDVICSCFCCIYIMFHHFQAICYIFVFFIIRSYIFQCNFIIECISHLERFIACTNYRDMINTTSI